MYLTHLGFRQRKRLSWNRFGLNNTKSLACQTKDKTISMFPSLL
jgi:hypothetical protein